MFSYHGPLNDTQDVRLCLVVIADFVDAWKMEWKFWTAFLHSIFTKRTGLIEKLNEV